MARIRLENISLTTSFFQEVVSGIVGFPVSEFWVTLWVSCRDRVNWVCCFANKIGNLSYQTFFRDFLLALRCTVIHNLVDHAHFASHCLFRYGADCHSAEHRQSFWKTFEIKMTWVCPFISAVIYCLCLLMLNLLHFSLIHCMFPSIFFQSDFQTEKRQN